MPYRAPSGGGMFGSSVYGDSRPQINVGEGIDAITEGASSLIRQAYTRQLAGNQLARQKTLDDQARAQQARENDRQDQELQLKQEQARRANIAAGWIPEHSDVGTAPTMSQVPTLQPPPTAIRAAVTSGAPAAPPTGTPEQQAITAGNAPLPAPAATPSGAPPVSSTSPLPSQKPVVTTVPEKFDPSISAKAVIEQMKQTGLGTREEHRQDFQREQQEARLAASQDARTYAAKARKDLETQQENAGKYSSKSGQAITANKLADLRLKYAAGFISRYPSYGDAVNAFRGEDGADLRASKVTENDLLAASGSADAKMTSQAVGQLPYNKDPAAAVDRVRQVRQLVSPSGATKTTPAGGRDEDLAPADDAETASAKAFAAKTPRKAGESNADYAARLRAGYAASKKTP